eukprot:3523973-Pyramimonas_sp.AAC.1
MVTGLVRGVVASGGAAICYYSELRYDETPMRTRCVDPEKPGPAAGDLQLEVADHDPVSTIITSCVSSHVAKIVQTLRSENVLLQLANGQFLLVRCP